MSISERVMYAIYGGHLEPQTRTKPMEVLCVGISRSGTESLRAALFRLGYSHVYHGWDTIVPPRFQLQEWYKLCVRKWPATATTAAAGNARQKQQQQQQAITAADFDRLLGHCAAVTDLPAAFFAEELMDAYPEAKVILNRRGDLDAWHRSFADTMGSMASDPVLDPQWLLSWFSRDLFWVRQCMNRAMVPLFFSEGDRAGKTVKTFERDGKEVYRRHVERVRRLADERGLTRENGRFLEWGVEDGWAPLCEFLGKEVPKHEPFPEGNTPKDWERRVVGFLLGCYATSLVNMMLVGGAGATAVVYGVRWYKRI